MKQERQTTASLALSIALHVLVGGVLVRVLTYPLPLDDLFVRDRAVPPVITYDELDGGHTALLVSPGDQH